MQKLVTELNQLAAERDALSRELRGRAPKARSWGGDGPPDLNNVPPLPTNHQAIEEWVNARNCGLRDALEFGYADVISQVSNMLAQGALKMATLSRVHGCPDPSWESHVLYGRCSRRQAEVSRRWRALSSPSTLKTRCRRCEAQYGFRGVRVGEGLHPGPAARPVRRSARLRAQEVSPIAVDSPSPPDSTLLDALEFDLTIAASTESELGGDESEVPESLAIAQFSGALISDRSCAQPGFGSGRFAVLVGNEQEDDSHFDIATVIDPLQLIQAGLGFQRNLVPLLTDPRPGWC